MQRALKIGLYGIITALALWASGIVPAIIPSAVPTPNKRGNSNLFQLAVSATPAAAGTVYCDDGSGNVTTSGCASSAPVTSVAGLTGAVPGQGTDGNVLTAGTVSGTGVTLCTDGNGGATTSGCAGGTAQIYTFSATATTTGQLLFQQVPAGCTIFGWSAIADPASAAATFTADLDAVANSAPPAVPAVPNTSTNKISASAPITFSSAQAASGGAAAITTWTKTRAQWDSFALNVTAFSSANYVNVSVWCQ